MAAIALALSAALMWGVGDFTAGLKGRQLQLLTVLVVSQVFGFVFVGVVTAASGDPVPDGHYILFAALSAVVGTIGMALFLRSMQVGKLSLVVPLVGMSAAVPVVVGIATGDRPAGLQIAGMGVALIGAILASREPEPDSGGGRLTSGALTAIASALAFGCFFLALDEASDGGAVWASMVNRATSVSLLIGCALIFRPALQPARAHMPALALVGFCDVMANVTFALALTKGLVSLVSVVASLYPVVTVLLARTVLHERIHRVQEAGVVAALGGVALIAAG